MQQIGRLSTPSDDVTQYFLFEKRCPCSLYVGLMNDIYAEAFQYPRLGLLIRAYGELRFVTGVLCTLVLVIPSTRTKQEFTLAKRTQWESPR